ncbi:MAG: GHKL domain-containing protein [Bacteriovoracaceae bacterium]|nr:GHKL domain-containing protein [Bacteriovoracaceae bacterium]
MIRLVASTSEFGFISAEENEVALIKTGIEVIRRGLEKLDATGFTIIPKNKILAENLTTIIGELINTCWEIVDLKRKGFSGEVVLEKKEEFEVIEKKIISIIGTLIDEHQNNLNLNHSLIFEQVRVSEYLIVIFIIFGIFVAVFLGKKILSFIKELELIHVQLSYTSKLASMGEMVGGIAHEINNPLAIINISVKNISKLANENKLSKENILEGVSNIEKTIIRISKIIDGLKTISRDTGKFEKTEVNLKDILQDIISLSSEKFRINEVSYRLDLEDKSFDKKILCDRVQISQVLINLLNNSYDAIENLDERWVEVRSLESQGFDIIKITDSGTGIPEKIQNSLFEPFYTSKGVGKGTGLGLSISKSILEMHHGSLEIDNSSQSTCFIIKLPKAVC